MSSLAPTRPAVSCRHADAPDLTELGRSIGPRFTLHRELGRGGLGRVFEASEQGRRDRVALKLLRAPGDPRAVDALVREIELTCRLRGDGVPAVLSRGWLPGEQPYYTMPIMARGSLADAIAARAELDDRLRLVPRLASAARTIARAHRRGVVHRDVKPANLMLTADAMCVIDWGVASGPGDDTTGITGTAAYMAPEQARGELATPGSDVYSLGATLYHLMAGRRPYRGRAWFEVLHQLLAGPPSPLAARVPDSSAALVQVVETAMTRDRRHRYPSADAFADALEAAQRSTEPKRSTR